jgi:hypothetical protein
MTLSRRTLTLTALAAVLALAAPAAAGHEIVLNDGTRVAAGSRPVIALGRVNFHDLNGRSRSLSASVVNLAETRASLRRNGERTQTVWTAADLERARGSIRLQTARAAGTPPARPPEPRRQGSVKRSSTQAQIELMESALDRVRAQRRMVKGYDTEAGILEERKSVIQSELLRLQTALEIEAEQAATP